MIRYPEVSNYSNAPRIPPGLIFEECARLAWKCEHISKQICNQIFEHLHSPEARKVQTINWMPESA